MGKNGRISIKVMCLFLNEGKVLATEVPNSANTGTLYRLIGGGLEFGELAESAIRREIQEEFNSGIDHLRFLRMVEDLTPHSAGPAHQISFLFYGEFSRRELYREEQIPILDAPTMLPATWIHVDAVTPSGGRLWPTLDYRRSIKDCLVR